MHRLRVSPKASVEAELSIAKEHLAANEAEAARLQKQNVELKEVARDSQDLSAVTDEVTASTADFVDFFDPAWFFLGATD